MKLLLGSGGFGTPERQQAWRSELDSFLGSIQRVIFIPYALADYDGYVQAMIARGFHADRNLVGIHTLENPRSAIESADAVYVGGGNSFRLLADLYRNDLLSVIRDRVRDGMPYIGVSAGTNMACPTMKTTNDMPITEPPSLNALGLVSFQINPHYFSGPFFFETPAGFVKYAGETRDDRIREFHEMNNTPVLGLWEGSLIRIDDRKIHLNGHEARARLFRKNETPKDLQGPAEITKHL